MDYLTHGFLEGAGHFVVAFGLACLLLAVSLPATSVLVGLGVVGVGLVGRAVVRFV